jgi:hypothetical protein
MSIGVEPTLTRDRIRAIFNLMSFQNGPQPMGHRGPPFHNLSKIEQIQWSQVKPTGRKVINLSYFTVIACSIVFFMCFATSELSLTFSGTQDLIVQAKRPRSFTGVSFTASSRASRSDKTPEAPSLAPWTRGEY